MINQDKYKQDEQQFWQAQFIDAQDSPISPQVLASVTGGATIPSPATPEEVAQLLTNTTEGWRR